MNITTSEELWGTSILPEGLLERWLVPDGRRVKAGEAIAELRIEDSLHEISAPISGRLKIAIKANGLIEPGSVLGFVDPAD